MKNRKAILEVKKVGSPVEASSIKMFVDASGWLFLTDIDCIAV